VDKEILLGLFAENAYNNNTENKDSKNLVRNINNRLRKNYRISRTVTQPGAQKKKPKPQTDLMGQGFSKFEYLTNTYNTTKNREPLLI